MKIIAINGSPRNKWNTAAILQHVLDGAKRALPEIETETVNLYRLNYKGCISCFECKRLGGSSYGKCAIKDEITPVLESVLNADGVIFGSPVYFSEVTGMMRCFWERLFFPEWVYDKAGSSLAAKNVHTAFIYTMNLPKEGMEANHYPWRFEVMQNYAQRIWGVKPQVLYVCDTYQFSDYDKYKMEIFTESDKAKSRETQFPLDCEKAEKVGANIVEALKKKHP